MLFPEAQTAAARRREGASSLNVDVRPSGQGWCVEVEPFERLLFARGADAERHGREIAAAIADTGRDVTLRIGGRDGWLVATLRWAPTAGGGASAPPIEKIIGEPRPVH